MHIYIETRNIPEIALAYRMRKNKKDSFKRWVKKVRPEITFNDWIWVEVQNEH